MKNIILILLVAIGLGASAQTDTIYKVDGEVLNVFIAGIDESSIEYIYPGEDFPNSIGKSSVTKIHFRSGRKQEFSSNLNLKTVRSCLDYENVQISNFESEVQALKRIDLINAKAHGWTTITSLSKLQDRAYKKIKIITAMLGGNVAFIVEQNTEAAMFGGEHGPTKLPFASVSGIAYCSKKVRPEEIMSGEYGVTSIFSLRSNTFDMKKEDSKYHVFNINEKMIYSDNKFQKIKIRIPELKKIREYTIIHADEKNIVLSGIYETKAGKKTYYNVIMARK